MRFDRHLDLIPALLATFFLLTIAAEPALSQPATVPLKENSRIYVEQERTPFPDLAFYDGNGNARRLSDFQGKPVLVNFWATWCAPCIRELPQLQTLSQEYSKSLHIITIAQDRKGFETITPFIKHHQLEHLDHYWDKKNREFRKLGMRGLPMSFLIDAQGRLIATIQGEIDWLEPDVVAFLTQHSP